MKLILDGNNLAYRANVTTDLSTKKGERVSAIYGSLQMIQSYLKPSQGKYVNKVQTALAEHLKLDEEETYFDDVVMCWDFGKSKRRMELYPDYKGHRAEKRSAYTEEEQNAYKAFLNQMISLHENLPKFGVKSLKLPGWEGDDLVYATTQVTDDTCVIVSTDKDMLQLVNERIFVWSPFKEVLVTPNNFVKVTGIPKASYLSYRILVGDSSDNINGVYGIGEKTAKDLMIKYGSIGGVLLNKEPLMKSKRTAKIFEDLSLLNRNELLMDMRAVELDEIQEEVAKIVNSSLKFDDKGVRAYLMSKEIVSIVADLMLWSQPFKMLG